jgi:hypothetical protein
MDHPALLYGLSARGPDRPVIALQETLIEHPIVLAPSAFGHFSGLWSLFVARVCSGRSDLSAWTI